MAKKVTFGTKQPVTADDWVNAGPKDPDTLDAAPAKEPETMKRLTIDVTESLHKAIKIACAERGVKMADAIRDLLTEHFIKDQQSQ